jgi:hypothetical protein
VTVIPFKRKSTALPAVIQSPFDMERSTVMDECEGIIHIFDSVPGRCMCGENLWTEDQLPAADIIGIHQVP